MDGGSTDGSVEIIKKYEKYLAYWVSEKDKGQSDAINKGFQKSTGEILAWLNSDDTYLPSTLWSVADFFKQNPNVDMLYGRSHMMDIYDKIFQEAKAMPFNLLDYIYGLFVIPQPATFWRKDIFFKVGMLNIETHSCMDYELWINCARNNASIVYTDIFLANFRWHAQSKTCSGRFYAQSRRDIIRIQQQVLGYSPSQSRIVMRKLYFAAKHPRHHIRYYLSVLRKGRVPVK